MTEPLRTCADCGLPVYRSDDCPRVYLHKPADYIRHQEAS